MLSTQQIHGSRRATTVGGIILARSHCNSIVRSAMAFYRLDRHQYCSDTSAKPRRHASISGGNGSVFPKIVLADFAWTQENVLACELDIIKDFCGDDLLKILNSKGRKS